jgi:predicted DNA-binding protein (MmcQ/YjbR family)
VKTEDLIEKALAHPGASIFYKIEWDATLGRLGEKMFMMIGQDHLGRQIVTLKLDPHQGEALRALYEGVFPGYYMNKTHWNSFLLDGTVLDDVIEDALNASYQLVLKSYPLKVQKRILNE